MRRQWHQRYTACSRCWTWFVWSFIVFSWLLRPLHINQMLFYHRLDTMLVLKINPIVGFVVNYLCLALGYLGKFLYYKTLTGWTWGNILRKIIVIFRLLWYYQMGSLTGPINNAYSDSGYKFEPFSIPQTQPTTRKVFKKRKKSPTIMR